MRYPLVKQTGLKECGPCSLASIIIYYHGYVSVEALSNMMNTTKNGTTAYDLIETAMKIGFNASGKKITFEELNSIHLPLIAHVTINNAYNHFIVLYKIDYKNKKVIVGDPALKVKSLTYDDFNAIWNNIIIELTPNKTLPNIKPKSLFSYIKDILKSNRKGIITSIILSVFFFLISLIYSLYMKYIIDNITTIKTTFIIVVISILIVKIVLFYLKNIISIKTSKQISLLLTNRVIKTLILLPYPYYRNHTSGEIISRFNDVESIKAFINEAVTFIIDIPFIIIIFIIMFYLNYVVAFSLLLLLSLYILYAIYIANKLESSIINYQNKKAFFNSLLVETITGFETIKGLNIEDTYQTKVKDSYSNLEDKIYDIEKQENYKLLSNEILEGLGLIVIIIIGIKQYNLNLISFGTIFVFYVLFNYLLNPLIDIVHFYLKYKDASNVSRRVQEFEINNKDKKEYTNYDISLKNLNYKIGLTTILNHINLDIKQGEKVFITGPSGSGKSTLLKIIKGYYTNYSSNKILYVSQHETLFTGTIYDNLIIKDNKNIAKVVNMCLVDKKLNMYIEENGFNLSGGEKARIVLARALLLPFEILVIDEGLNEIDINKERVILKNIFKEYKNKTIIVISHRLDNLDLYNHFIEIDKGMIVKDTKLHID